MSIYTNPNNELEKLIKEQTEALSRNNKITIYQNYIMVILTVVIIGLMVVTLMVGK